MNAAGTLEAVKRQRPEWAPWLAVVDLILGEATNTRWDAVVPAPPEERVNGTPLLAGASLSVNASAARRLLERLMRVAARAGAPKMATLSTALAADADVFALLRASVRQQSDDARARASAQGADAEAFDAVIALFALPVLHACRRVWSVAMPGSWTQGYCPVCGSWPAFAEVRGIERSRYLRCGRCGGAWYAPVLRCGYCGTTDHEELVALVSETDVPRAVDACSRCLGYVKTFTRLQGCTPSAVLVDDLASVDLDVAAIDRGFTRPSGAGYPLDVAIAPSAGGRRRFAWYV